MWLDALVAVAAGLLIVWLALVAVLWRAQRHTPDRASLRDSLRLVPDVVRLLLRLSSDRSLPGTIRVRIWLLLAYLVSPIDLIPDFIPVIGYADDALIVAVAIRSVVRRAGLATLEQHWPGTPDGLSAVLRLARIGTSRT